MNAKITQAESSTPEKTGAYSRSHLSTGSQSTEAWIAKDDTEITGRLAVCLFRHEPALSAHGYWWCHETDDRNGGRWPIEELIALKRGEKMKISITANTKVRHGLTNNQKIKTMSKTIENPATEAVDLNRLVSGEFYWIKYHNHWEVAMWEDSCKWWLVAREHATEPEMIEEIGHHVPRPDNVKM